MANQGQVLIARSLGGDNWNWEFELLNSPLTGAETISLQVQRWGNVVDCPVEFVKTQGQATLLRADVSPIKAAVQNANPAYWILSLAIGEGEARQVTPLGHAESISGSDAYKMQSPIGQMPFVDCTVEAIAWPLNNGSWGIRLSDSYHRYDKENLCYSSSIKIINSQLRYQITCSNTIAGKWVGISFNYIYQTQENRVVYQLPADKIEQVGQNTRLSGRVDLNKFDFMPAKWFLGAVFEDEHANAFSVPISAKKGISQRLHLFNKAKIQGFDIELSETIERTYKFNILNRTAYHGWIYYWKEEFASVIYKLFKPIFDKKNIYLIYEKNCTRAQDNGYYFFKYCMDNNLAHSKKRQIYFIIDKKQPDYSERLLDYRSHVIQFMSFKYMLYVMAAKLIVSSESRFHGYLWGVYNRPVYRSLEEKKAVFLQHGVTAFKRVQIFSADNSYANYDFFVTSNQQEKAIVVNELNYKPEDVIVTGLARWDALEDRSLQRRVLIMPTFRTWLRDASRERFRSSEYLQKYMSLLNSVRLRELAREEDLYIDFYIHPLLAGYLEEFNPQKDDRIRLIYEGQEPLNELMMKCKLMITDYSSASWDVFYQGKPVLFYQFDVDKYLETNGAYVDFDTDLTGDRASEEEELVDLLEAYAKDDFKLPEKYVRKRQESFEYIDKNNSKRIFEELEKRGW